MEFITWTIGFGCVMCGIQKLNVTHLNRIRYKFNDKKETNMAHKKPYQHSMTLTS
jgi:hypothetical protein